MFAVEPGKASFFDLLELRIRMFRHEGEDRILDVTTAVEQAAAAVRAERVTAVADESEPSVADDRVLRSGGYVDLQSRIRGRLGEFATEDRFDIADIPEIGAEVARP